MLAGDQGVILSNTEGLDVTSGNAQVDCGNQVVLIAGEFSS